MCNGRHCPSGRQIEVDYKNLSNMNLKKSASYKSFCCFEKKTGASFCIFLCIYVPLLLV